MKGNRRKLRHFFIAIWSKTLCPCPISFSSTVALPRDCSIIFFSIYSKRRRKRGGGAAQETWNSGCLCCPPLPSHSIHSSLGRTRLLVDCWCQRKEQWCGVFFVPLVLSFGWHWTPVSKSTTFLRKRMSRAPPLSVATCPLKVPKRSYCVYFKMLP